MKASAKMQQVIEQLAAKHGVDLTVDGAHLRLEMPHFDRLTIENIGQSQVSVAHYFEQNGDLVADPEIVFYTCAMGWYPIEITQILTGWTQVAVVSDGSITRLAAAQQADIARFATTWARNIESQGWKQRGVHTSVSGATDK